MYTVHCILYSVYCILYDMPSISKLFPGNDLLVILDTNVRVYTWDDSSHHDRELIHNEKQDINFDAQVRNGE